ncbi:37S ribosomal protein S9, mitochondrial [Talaromyces islandicus]|uniref:Small ribosomal subunit protein uS9m n=1 Tax=Talaromyces islandicus TaxID=28573 RepID=A0A0U1LZS3_TALIS|nr:37S ribosomal protein S9, mitochondrial [Talaromyces islandicus]
MKDLQRGHFLQFAQLLSYSGGSSTAAPVPYDTMALQRSACLSRGVCEAVLSAATRKTSAMPIGSLPLLRVRQMRQFSSSPRRRELEVIKAAPEIQLGKFAVSPTRIIPSSPSYFSGSPKFIDHQIKLEALLDKYSTLPTVSASEAPRMAWFKLAQFRDFLGEPIPAKKYKNFQKVLQRLNRILPSVAPPEVRKALNDYVRPGNPYANKPAPAEVDEFGRGRGKGKRKESSAVVSLVEGEGHVMVNDRNIVDVFPRVHDRESALWALRCTSRLDKYNVWARVSGGGVTGQAEAITLAVARALMVHEPALKPILRQAGVISVDARRVERKKPGHVKARKMPTWVKRHAVLQKSADSLDIGYPVTPNGGAAHARNRDASRSFREPLGDPMKMMLMVTLNTMAISQPTDSYPFLNKALASIVPVCPTLLVDNYDSDELYMFKPKIRVHDDRHGTRTKIHTQAARHLYSVD